MVDCTGLENRRRETVLGFKSLPLRHILLFCKTQKSRSYKAAFLCLIASPQPYKACATLLRAGPTTALRAPYKERNTFLKKCPAICRALGNNTMYLKTVVTSKRQHLKCGPENTRRTTNSNHVHWLLKTLALTQHSYALLEIAETRQ